MGIRRKKQTKDEVTLVQPLRGSDTPGLGAACTCGWFTGYKMDILAVGLAAKKHAQKTGHELRKH